RPGELCRQLPVLIVAHENAEAVPVQIAGQLMGGKEAMKQTRVAVQVFVGSKVQGQDLAGGVIHSTEQVPAWGLLPEPRVFAGIDQDQRSSSGLAPPAATVPGSTAPSHGRDAGRLPQASHGLATDVELLEFAQL